MRCENCLKDVTGKETFQTFYHNDVCSDCYDKEMHTIFSKNVNRFLGRRTKESQPEKVAQNII